MKEKDGRRNRYSIQSEAPLREDIGREKTIGELLALLVDTGSRGQKPKRARAKASVVA